MPVVDASALLGDRLRGTGRGGAGASAGSRVRGVGVG